MSERITITPLGLHIGARPRYQPGATASDSQFEQLYHALDTPSGAVRARSAHHAAAAAGAGDALWRSAHSPGLPACGRRGGDYRAGTHNDNPPDNDNWHTDVTFIDTPPAGAILAAKALPPTAGDTLWTSGIAAFEALSAPFQQCCCWPCAPSTISGSRSRSGSTRKRRKSRCCLDSIVSLQP